MSEVRTTYAEQLRHPLWQRRRLEIMQRAHFACEKCGTAERTLNVHHTRYHAHRAPWNYDDTELACLCEDCHLIGHLREATRSKEVEIQLEEMIEGAYVILAKTKDPGTRACAFRVMTGLIALRPPAVVARMERAKGLR